MYRRIISAVLTTKPRIMIVLRGRGGSVNVDITLVADFDGSLRCKSM